MDMLMSAYHHAARHRPKNSRGHGHFKDIYQDGTNSHPIIKDDAAYQVFIPRFCYHKLKSLPVSMVYLAQQGSFHNRRIIPQFPQFSIDQS